MGPKRPAFLVPVIGMVGLIAAILFLLAGTVDWPAGWTFLLSFFAFTMAITTWLARHDPELLTERMTGHRAIDQKAWDRRIVAVLKLGFVAWLIVIPLDAVRFRWSVMPLWLQVIGALLVFGSFPLFFNVYRSNRYLSPVVRIQAERGHSVASTGPYSRVRHPMYAAAILMLLGGALLLGSWYGVAVTALLTIGIAMRAVREERTLRAELPGYDAYMDRVRYRLIPGVW
jgi:protein-S-isoprenylcysteine O-methyltransferase Ste14